MPGHPILQVKNLAKEYGSLKMILGTLEPTAGSIEIFGSDIRHNRSKTMKRVNFSAVYAAIPGNMTVRQNLYIFGLLYGVKELNARIGAIILWSFLIRVQQGMVLAFFEDVWSRNFLNLFSSPLTVREYLAGMVLTAIGTSAAGITIFFTLAFALFGYNIFSLGAALRSWCRSQASTIRS